MVELGSDKESFDVRTQSATRSAAGDPFLHPMLSRPVERKIEKSLANSGILLPLLVRPLDPPQLVRRIDEGEFPPARVPARHDRVDLARPSRKRD